MKFDVIIGNPPYQLDDGGAQASAMPIYQLFVEQSIKLKPRYIAMIIPSRWFTGGRSLLDGFRTRMLSDSRLSQIHDFEDARECFPNVEIKGGVNYFLWERDKVEKECFFVSYRNGCVKSKTSRCLKIKGLDVLIRHNEAIKILDKVIGFQEDSFDKNVNSAMFFGFRTYFKDYESLNKFENSVKVYGNRSFGYIDRSKILKNIKVIDMWKVIVPEAVGVGDMRKDKLNPILSEPGSINTETYIMNGPYKTKNEAENVISYIQTNFFHFLIGLVKNTQHTTKKVYQFIPMQDFTKAWTDKALYEKYKLSKEEIDFIETMVRPMD